MRSRFCLVPCVGVVLAFVLGAAARAEEFKEENSKITLHVPDDWKRSEAKEADDVMKLTLQKGVPTHSDDYYVVKLGHIVIDAESTLEGFKDDMVKAFPADWKALDVSKTTVGKEKIAGLRVPYNFLANGIPFRMDLFIIRRGKQYTFLEFVGTQKAYDALHKELEKIVDDADVDAGK